MELNEREQNIVNLINELSKYADDETTTQEALDGIINKIRDTANDNLQHEMEKAETYESRPKVVFPADAMSSKISDAIDAERNRMLNDIQRNNDNLDSSLMQHEHHMDSGKMFLTRIREVKVPGKAHQTDAGIDFYIPNEKAWDDDFKKKVIDYSKNPNEDDVYFVEDDDGIGMYVKPNAHVAIPSGIKTIIPQGLGMMFVNKSGIATKMKLDHSACLVDSEYRDEIIMCFFNHNTDRVLLRPGMKITQGLIVPIINMDIQEVLNCVYDDMGKDTDRGGGFGSSGTK